MELMGSRGQWETKDVMDRELEKWALQQRSDPTRLRKRKTGRATQMGVK